MRETGASLVLVGETVGREGLKTRIGVGVTWRARGKDPSRVSSVEGTRGQWLSRHRPAGPTRILKAVSI